MSEQGRIIEKFRDCEGEYAMTMNKENKTMKSLKTAAAILAITMLTSIAAKCQTPGYAARVDAAIMDSLGFKATVIHDGNVLAIGSDLMSEPLARNMLNAGLLQGAKDNGFTTVRFMNHNHSSSAVVWQYETNGTMKHGGITCKNSSIFDSKNCKLSLESGLSVPAAK
jgi:hypothetical protein